MNEIRFYTLASEIEDELRKIRELLRENEEACHRINQGERFDFLSLRGQGDIIHDFYTGFEKILKKIATDLNGGLSSGEDWHKRLLYQMSFEIKEIRPAVISQESYGILKKLLAFRHVFRNIYGFDLDKERLDELSLLLLEKGDDLIKELLDFAELLRKGDEK
ncbi:MAG: hypothetical protein QME81_14020 [bacterium]|nr:hypothetical protein [bacterium]